MAGLDAKSFYLLRSVLMEARSATYRYNCLIAGRRAGEICQNPLKGEKALK